MGVLRGWANDLKNHIYSIIRVPKLLHNCQISLLPTLDLSVPPRPMCWICINSRVREDHLKSDLDQRSRSDKWSRSFYPKDHLKRKDQDLDQDHPKRSLSCTKDGDIYSVISHILSHWWVMKSFFQIMLKTVFWLITILLKLELRGHFLAY